MITCTPMAAAARKHLLDVVKALREASGDTHLKADFTMKRFINPCGTPGCALGHYAFREDLQSEFMLRADITCIGAVLYKDVAGPHRLYFSDRRFKQYFGLWNIEEADELFRDDGCGNAKTPLEAADYIESFVARKWPQWVKQ